jgi:hypothetical protein
VAQVRRFGAEVLLAGLWSWGQGGQQGDRVAAAAVDDAVDEQGGGAEYLA